jgi:hypothetical protein
MRLLSPVLLSGASAFLLSASGLSAQERPRGDAFDTAYVRDYSHILTGRAYLSTKYNKLQLGGLNDVKALIYRPNNRINMGVGASYRALTLNLGVGIPVLNQDDAIRGTTRYLDAQANIYTKHWATNLFLQEFQGYYIASHRQDELDWDQETAFPTRPDVVEFNVGASTVHIFNNDRFSYRAAFNQDAWQRKSQGTFLAGGYATFFHLQADSSLVPEKLAMLYKTGLHLQRGDFWDIGPSLGYAYTVVFHEHWFLTGSTVLGGGLSILRALTDEDLAVDVLRKSAGVGWHGQFRAGAGYNAARYYVGMSFNQENIGYLIDDRSSFYWSVGNFRLNFVKRFNMHIGFMDKGIRWFRKKVQEPVEKVVPNVG